ncbi:MAG: hypothetical protein ABI406_11655 [Ktedonobacteraceae bacterium]
MKKRPVIPGSDLLQLFKEVPEYYSRLFADLQIAPAEALIVDDSIGALSWTSELGANTVCVGAARETSNGTMSISSLAELPTLLQQMV